MIILIYSYDSMGNQLNPQYHSSHTVDSTPTPKPRQNDFPMTYYMYKSESKDGTVYRYTIISTKSNKTFYFEASSEDYARIDGELFLNALSRTRARTLPPGTYLRSDNPDHNGHVFIIDYLKINQNLKKCWYKSTWVSKHKGYPIYIDIYDKDYYVCGYDPTYATQ